MLSSKLAQVFFSLNNYEKAALKHFVYSPYHNKREDVKILFDYLHSQSHETSPHLQKATVWQFVYQEKPFDAAQFRYLMNFLLATIEDFLIIRSIYEDNNVANLKLIESYHELQLDAPFEHSIQKARLNLEKQPLRDSSYLHHFYAIENIKYAATYTFGREKDRGLQPFADSLETFIIAEKLRLACILQAHEAVYKIKYDKGILPAVLEAVGNNPKWLEYEAIYLYYYYYQTTNTSDSGLSYEYFRMYKSKLLSCNQQFSQAELKNFYMMAINYGIRQINSALSFLRETLDLYIAALAKGLLLEKKQISRFAFKNIVAIGIHLKEFDFARNFISQNAHLLPADYKETYTHYCYCKLDFVEKNYREAMKRLLQVEYEDIFLNLDAKIMLIKIYYELQEYDALESFLAAFKVFLNRKRKVLSYHYENYKNIARSVSNLMQINPYSKETISKFRDKIVNIKVLTERGWLLAQIDNFRK